MIYFSRVLMLDKYFSKKTYISLALCENQLNNVDRCVYHVIYILLRLTNVFLFSLIFINPTISKENYFISKKCTIWQ